MREFVGEVIGTYILVLFGCGAVAGAVLFGAFTSLLEVAFIWGFAVALGIFSSKHLSQSHLNPAVSIAFLLEGMIKPKQLIPYITGQFVGAFIAGLTLYGMFSGAIAKFETEHNIIRGEKGSELSAMMFGEYYPNPAFEQSVEIGMWSAAGIEMLGTFLLVFIIFRLIAKREDVDNMTPLYIGLTVTLIITLIAPFTQACLNPARDLAPRMVAWLNGWGDAAFPADPGGFLVVYILGPIAGGVLAYLFNHLVVKKLMRQGEV